MNGNAPTRKVTLGAGVGAGVGILVWALNQYAGAGIPAEIAVAGSTLLTFVAQYFIPEPPKRG